MISLLGHIRAFLLSATPPPEPCLPSFPLSRAPHPLAEGKQPPLPDLSLSSSAPSLPTPRLRKALVTSNEGLADFVSQSPTNPPQIREGLGLHTYNWTARWLLNDACFTKGSEVKTERHGPRRTVRLSAGSMGLTVFEDEPIAFRILPRLLRVHLKKAGVTDLEIVSVTDTYRKPMTEGSGHLLDQ